MVKSYIKIALRTLNSQKLYSFINIMGLAVGLSVCILIYLWVQEEINYDRFHENAQNIYKVVFADESYDNIRHYSVTPPALAAALKKDYPEIVNSLTYYSRSNTLLSHKKTRFKETLGFTSSSIFDLFSIPFVSGNPETALEKPFSIVISEKLAKKYFGEDDPLTKIITLDNKIDVTITGIFEDLPENSFLKVNVLASFDQLYELTGRGKSDSWDSFGYNTFIILSAESDPSVFNQKISDYAINSHDYGTFKPKLYLQPLLDMHLYNLNGGGTITYIYIFSFLAVFILLLACVNFMNLVTARSAIRTKEISLRKVIGAQRKNLIFQFLGESILLAILSLILSLIFVERLIPVFNEMIGATLSFASLFNAFGITILISITLLTGIVSGSYPALFLSSFKPVTVLKNLKISGSSPLRNILVVFQFSISIIMIVCALVVFDQLTFVKNWNLGFNKDHILYIPLNQQLKSKLSIIKNNLSRHPQVINATATSNKIGISQFHSVDLTDWEGNIENKSILIGLIYTDYDFISTFNIDMIEGRYYSQDFKSDSLGIVINQAAIKEMGIKNPIGKKIFERSHIIGVIKDFNYQSLHSGIGPLAIGMNPKWDRYLALKIRPENIAATISHLESVVKQFSPEFPFEYSFLDKEFEKSYHSEQRLGKTFLYVSILAVFISALGLFGLATFTSSQRRKEIGVRKVLGASVSGIMLQLSREFTKWVFVSNMIAWPVGWYIMSQWLENFAYRTPVSLWAFVIAGFITFLIAIISVSSQAIRAAYTNPVEALRHE